MGVCVCVSLPPPLHQTNLVKEQVRVKLEQRLADKEGELMFIRSQLNEVRYGFNPLCASTINFLIAE